MESHLWYSKLLWVLLAYVQNKGGIAKKGRKCFCLQLVTQLLPFTLGKQQ